MLQLQNRRSTNAAKITAWLLSIVCVALPVNIAHSNILADADGKDDSQVIIDHIKQSLSSGGLISVEQHTGRLLFNPQVDKLNSMVLKQKFLMPAMIVNQKTGLKLVGEMPFSCFMLSAGELSHDNYKGYRQYETIRYIRDVKNFAVSRALICETVGSSSKLWKAHLSLQRDEDPFVFEEHVSLTGEHFYYFLNNDGSFEMYM